MPIGRRQLRGAVVVSGAIASRRRRALLGAIFLLPFAHAATAAPVAAEQARIEYLIRSIAALEGAVFIRNGSSYSAADAADHLRLKLSKAGARVATAEDFIVLCGAKSSTSGQPYRIRYADGREVTSEAFLRERRRTTCRTTRVC